MKKALILCAAVSMMAAAAHAQAVFVPASGTTTYPSSPPSNAPGTTGVPIYSKADGAAIFDLLDPIPAGTNVIGGVTQSGTWTVAGTFWPYTLGQQLANVSVPVVLTAAQLTTLTPPTNTGYALDTSVNGLLLSQASATSGQKGTLGFAAATTSAPTYTTGQSYPLSLTTAGALRTDASATTQPISASSLPLPTGAAADSSVNGLLVSQGSTTASQKGPLAQAAVGSSAPTYSAGQTSPLSLTTAGALRTDASATTQPVSGTVTANAGSGTFAVSAASLPLPAGASTAANQSSVESAPGTPQTVAVTVQGNTSGVPIPVTATQSNLTVGPTSVTSATTVTTLATAGYRGVGFNLFSIGGGATVIAEGSKDAGTTWSTLDIYNPQSHVTTSSVTATGQYGVVLTGGETNVRIRCTVYSSGSVTVTETATSIETQVNAVTVMNGSLPLPTGASTAALQSGVQSAPGTPQTTAVTVQGNASGVALPVSGTVTANAGTGNMGANITQVGGNAVVTGGVNGTQAVGGMVASAGTNAGNPVKTGGAFNTTQPIVTNGQVVDAQMTARGAQIVATGADTFNVTVNSAIAAGTNSIGTVQIGNTPNTTPILVTQSPSTSGGASAFSVIAAASTNLTSVKGSGGQVYGWTFSNPAAYAVYVKLYNVASGSVTVGTTTPFFEIGVPATGAVTFHDPNGIAMSTAITYAITKLSPVTDTTVVAAGDCVGMIDYK